MKKLLTLALTAALLLSAISLCTLSATAADGDTTIKYGSADLALTLVDGFDEEQTLPGFMNWGDGTMSNGELFLSSSLGMYDNYDIVTEALKANPTLGGNKYIAFQVINTSDGDIRMCFQPRVMKNGEASIAFLSQALATGENTVKLVDSKGKAEDARYTDLSSGRDVFVIPYGFEGTIIIPQVVLATNPVDAPESFAPDGVIEYSTFGFHVVPDDATYVELTFTDVYAFSELPAYVAETEAPTEKPTEKSTEAPTEAPTAAPTDAPTDAPTEAPTDAPTAAPTEAPTDEPTAAPTDAPTDAPATEAPAEGGCGATIGMGAVAILCAAAAAVALKKRD